MLHAMVHAGCLSLARRSSWGQIGSRGHRPGDSPGRAHISGQYDARRSLWISV